MRTLRLATVAVVLAATAPLVGMFPSSPAVAGDAMLPSIKTMCSYTGRSLQDDPIVFPRQPGASHLHDFFGNVSLDAFSTIESLAVADTTCDFSEDLSGYWAPALLVDGTPRAPQRSVSYYTVNGRDPSLVQPHPHGLRIVAGNAKSTVAQQLERVSWRCNADTNDADTGSPTASIPTCLPDQHLSLKVRFPECWDGVNLDSSDHKSHMTYMPSMDGCPASHPVLVPELMFVVHYDGYRGGPGYALASGGQYSGHADFFNAWVPERYEELVATCLRTGTVCRNSDLRVAGSQVTEPGTLRFTISLSEPSPFPTSVDYATSDRMAVAGADYVATSGRATIPAGSIGTTVSVATLDDAVPEPPEALYLNLSNPQNAEIFGGGRATGTIEDDDTPPAIRVLDASVAEALDNTVKLFCELVLDKPSEARVSVQFATADGTATSPADFAATSGTVAFRAGVTSKRVAITVKPDTNFTEGAEGLSLVLSSPQNATIRDGVADLTITDPAMSPKVYLGDTSLAEGARATMTVTLSAPPSAPVAIDYTTTDGSAVAGGDYLAATGTVTIPAGSTSRTIQVQTVDDAISEADERFKVVLTRATNATLIDENGMVDIVDDDPLPTIRISNASASEPATGTRSLKFTVTLSQASGRAVSFRWATADGTALAPGDYTAGSGSMMLPVGVTEKTIIVAVNADGLVEGTESMEVRLSAVEGAMVGDGTGVGTITPM